jgi:hypothetical protein
MTLAQATSSEVPARQFSVGELVAFRLDGKREGEGRIKEVWSNILYIEVTKECEEFAAGCEIVILKNEVVR